ncbi:unnamed protein product [Echinostoma caproni]|uniref:WD_REPEATS_REGION domain-containing protein n=1 Tax=Echinostoma caproni TaxID=27848 RepID=A0A183ADH3_9TREM|nr:unnamed protein product [Echinostoma caproni]
MFLLFIFPFSLSLSRCLTFTKTATDASTERFLNSRDSTDSQSASTQSTQQPMRRKPVSGTRADSPAVGGDLSGSAVATGGTTGDGTTENKPLASSVNKPGERTVTDTNGNVSRASAGSRLSDPGRSSSLARARKRARNDTRRLGMKNSTAHTALLSSTNNGIRSMDGDDDADDDDDLGPEDDEDDDDDSGAMPGVASGRALSNRPDFSDLDSPLDDLHAGTDLDTPYRGRQRRQTYQMPPRRRDSSLGGYGHSSFYGGPAGAGTLPRRHRLDVSLTRATTIGGGDGTLRSAQRLAQSIRSGVIPPPPSEPPPATPLSGSLMSELGAIGVSAGGSGASGLINPFALQLHNQQQQQQQRQAAALAAAVAASGGVHPQLFSAVGAQASGLNNPYLLGGELLCISAKNHGIHVIGDEIPERVVTPKYIIPARKGNQPKEKTVNQCRSDSELNCQITLLISWKMRTGFVMILDSLRHSSQPPSPFEQKVAIQAKNRSQWSHPLPDWSTQSFLCIRLRQQQRQQQQSLSLPGLITNADPSQILQLQQQALLLQQQQHQQQQLDAHIRQQQQQQQQQLLVGGLLQPTYSSNYGTLGRPTRTDSVGPMQSYLSAAALLSAQQQQQQARQYQAHSTNGVIQSPSSALASSEQGDAIMNKSTNAQGGSGSVVYENSYNSFHR